MDQLEKQNHNVFFLFKLHTVNFQCKEAKFLSDSPPPDTTNTVKRLNGKIDLSIKLKSHQVVLFTSNFNGHAHMRPTFLQSMSSQTVNTVEPGQCILLTQSSTYGYTLYSVKSVNLQAKQNAHNCCLITVTVQLVIFISFLGQIVWVFSPFFLTVGWNYPLINIHQRGQ